MGVTDRPPGWSMPVASPSCVVTGSHGRGTRCLARMPFGMTSMTTWPRASSLSGVSISRRRFSELAGCWSTRAASSCRATRASSCSVVIEPSTISTTPAGAAFSTPVLRRARRHLPRDRGTRPHRQVSVLRSGRARGAGQRRRAYKLRGQGQQARRIGVRRPRRGPESRALFSVSQEVAEAIEKTEKTEKPEDGRSTQARQRRERILEVLRDHAPADLALNEIPELIGASLATTYRDVDALREQGRVRPTARGRIAISEPR
jgi:hypothetical protein